MAKYGDERLPARFWEKTVIECATGCWLWVACKQKPGGYGKYQVGYSTRLAHREAYRVLISEVERGLQLDHLCRNRACVNPSHLEPVSHRENQLRGEGFVARNSQKTHCPMGHELVGDNLDANSLARGRRDCRLCRNTRKRRAARRAGGIAPEKFRKLP
jgi:hypothetical protein